MLSGKLDSITLEDVQRFAADKVHEGKTIEYKGAFYRLDSEDEKDKRKQHVELLKDISSFANTIGGDILIGVSEEGGVPKEVCGFQCDNADKLKLRMLDLVRDWIEPRIGLNIHIVPHSEGRYVFVIRVSQSTIGPHRVIYQNEPGQFYARSSGGAFSMDTVQLRQSFTMSETINERIRSFHSTRVSKIIAGGTPIVLSEKPKLILHLIPVDSFASQILLDPVEIEPLSFRLPLIGNFRSSTNRVNLDGVAVFDEPNHEKPSSGYLQIFRNGIIETVVDEAIRVDSTPQHRPMFDYTLMKQVFQGTQYHLEFLRGRNISPPVWCFMTLTGAKHFEIWSRHARYKYPCDRDIVTVPEVQITDLTLPDYSGVMRPLFDSLWNAAGHTHCHMYDANGKFQDGD